MLIRTSVGHARFSSCLAPKTVYGIGGVDGRGKQSGNHDGSGSWCCVASGPRIGLREHDFLETSSRKGDNLS